MVFIIFHLQIHSWEPYFSLATCWNDDEFLSLSKSFGLPSMFWTQKTMDQLKNFASPLSTKIDGCSPKIYTIENIKLNESSLKTLIFVLS